MQFCFLQFLTAPFTAENPLVSKEAMQHFSKFDKETNESTSWMARVDYISANFLGKPFL